jgi:DNA-binding MarR family transcriptional regulator
MKNKRDIAGMTLELGRLIRREMDANADGESALRMHGACYVAEHPDLTMTEFAAFMKSSKSTATEFVDRLVKADVVRRVQDDRNRKTVRLRLTPNGRRAVSLHLKRKQAVLKKLFSRLSAADRGELERIFSLLLGSSPTSHD